MFTSKSKASVSLRYFIFLFVISLGSPNCYKLKIEVAKATGSQFYKHKLKLYPNNTVSTEFHVMKPVATPIWHLQLSQSGDGFRRVHYNEFIKACSLLKFIKNVRFLRELVSTFFSKEKGNMSLSCPLLVGTYVMNNLFIPPESNFLRFMYMPNSVITLKGGVHSLLANKKREKLSTFEFNGTMTKSC